MPQPNAQNATNSAAEFLTRCFAPGETIALLLRREVSGRDLQTNRPIGDVRLRLVTSAGSRTRTLPERTSMWLPIRFVSDSRKRTKECIAAVRHLYLDLDTDGEARLSSLRASDAVPPPNAILSTSPGKYQVLWRVDGFTLRTTGKRAETACHYLWRRSRLHRLQPGPPPARIPELQVRSGASRDGRIPRRFHLEFR